MQFNSEANKQDLCSDMDYWASTDSVTYPIEDKTRNANFALSRITTKIMQADSTWKHISSETPGIPIAVTDVVPGVDNYTLESKHLKILRVRMKDANGVFRTLIAKDRRKVSDDVLNSAGGNSFEYDKIGYSLMPLPVPNYGSVGGLEIEYQPGADYFSVTDTTKEPGFNPDFHRLVSLYAARDYCALHARDRIQVIDTEIIRMESDIVFYFSSRDIDDEPSFTVKKVGSIVYP